MNKERLRRSIAALALVGEAGELCRRRVLARLSETDRLSLERQLDAAAHHILNALETTDHWNALDMRRKEWAIEAYGSRHLKRMPERNCVGCLIVAAESLLMTLLNEDELGAEEVSRAVAHLQCAVHLAEPKELATRIARADPRRRVAFGERLREIEEDVTKMRALVRSGR